jgi:hypothetical protein
VTRFPSPALGLILSSLLVLGLVGGCRGDGRVDDVPVEVEVRVAPTPPAVGPARIVLAVTDPEGAPVEGAQVRVDATMDHPGMVPVLGTAEDRGGGNHVIPALEFSMAGDWILFVRIRLPDGQEAIREHRLRVVSSPTSGPGS